MSVSVEPPPEAFNFAAHLLETNAGRPDKLAFIDDERRLTYRELDERVRRFAAALEGRRRQARGARASAHARFVRLAGRFPRRDLRRRRAGRGQHAAHRRRLRLHARARARAGRDRQRRGEAGAEGRADPVRPRSPQGGRLAPDPAARIRRGRVRGVPRPARAAREGRRAPTPTIPLSGSIRRARPAAPREPSIRTPTRTGRPSSTARRSWTSARRTSASRRRSCFSPTASATP